jgi:hypothetical protein
MRDGGDVNIFYACLILICGTAFAVLWPNQKQGYTIVFLAFLAGLILVLAGCAPTQQKPIVQYKTVEVSKYIRAPIPPEYTADRIVTEPPPLCVLAGPPKLVVYCQNQVAELVDAYRAALRQSNLDKQALRSLDAQQPE